MSDVNQALSLMGTIFKIIGWPMSIGFYAINTLYLHTAYLILTTKDPMFYSDILRTIICGGCLVCGLVMYFIHAKLRFGSPTGPHKKGKDWRPFLDKLNVSDELKELLSHSHKTIDDLPESERAGWCSKCN